MQKIKTLLFLAGCLITPMQANNTRHRQIKDRDQKKFKTGPRKFKVKWATKGIKYDQKMEVPYSRLTETKVTKMRNLILTRAKNHTVVLSKPRYLRTLAISPSCLTYPILLKFLQNKGDFNQ